MIPGLVVNVEEYIAWWLYQHGEPLAARVSIHRADSLPNDLSFDRLEPYRQVPITDDEVAARVADALDAAWVQLRSDRDAALVASDWTQLPDVPDATRDAWAVYRQALRDLPTKTTDPTQASWPEPPA